MLDFLGKMLFSDIPGRWWVKLKTKSWRSSFKTLTILLDLSQSLKFHRCLPAFKCRPWEVVVELIKALPAGLQASHSTAFSFHVVALSVWHSGLELLCIISLFNWIHSRDAWVAQRLSVCLQFRAWSRVWGSNPTSGSPVGACSPSAYVSASLCVSLMNK